MRRPSGHRSRLGLRYRTSLVSRRSGHGVLPVRLVRRPRAGRRPGAFRHPGQYAALRLSVQSPASDVQPRRSADRVFPHRASPGQGPFQCWQGNWVGLTCAACHTGQVNYHGTSLLIEGGPAQNDIETFRAGLAQAFGANATNPEKAQRFVGRVLARRPDLSPAAVQAGLQCFGQASVARARFEQEALRPPTSRRRRRLRPARRARARRQLPVRGEHRDHRELQADDRAGQLPGPVGHAVL